MSLNISNPFLIAALSNGAAQAWTKMPLWRVGVQSGLILLAVIGNCWLLYKGMSKKSLRNSVFHIILMNQSLVNLLLASFCYTSFVFKLREGVSKNEVEIQHCMYFTFVLLILVEISLFTNGFVAVNRALSCHPLLPISVALRSKKATILCLAVMWVVSAVLYLCPFATQQDSWARVFSCRTMNDILSDVAHGRDPRNPSPAKEILSWTLAATLMLIIVINAISYAVIITYLLKQHRLGKNGGGGSEQRQREKKRALLIIVLLFCVLLVCWSPATCILIIDPTVIAKNHVYMFLPSLESAIDPILCVITMPAFRPGWFSTVGRKTGQVSAQIDTQSTQNSRAPGTERRGTMTGTRK